MKQEEKYVLWSNCDLNPDDWREEYAEFLEVNEIQGDPKNENELYDWIVETNYSYLEDERLNLDNSLPFPIIIIADMGRWNGRVSAYKMVDSGNIADCLYSEGDMVKWYVDDLGDLRATVYHHDGTNFYLYRRIKDNVSSVQLENFQQKLLDGDLTRKDITRITQRLGDEIAKVYGWDIPKQKRSK